MLKQFGRLVVGTMFVGLSGMAAAVPITDMVTVDGKEWAQADLFANLSWSQIDAVCPGGVCGTGTLNGYDMAGWTWASGSDVSGLFNHYIGSPILGPGFPIWSQNGAGPSAFAGLFFADGWRINYHPSAKLNATIGRTADDAAVIAAIFESYVFSPEGLVTAGTQFSANQYFLGLGAGQVGAWFSRNAPESVETTPDPAIPSPSTLLLLGLGFAALRAASRTKPEQDHSAV